MTDTSAEAHRIADELEHAVAFDAMRADLDAAADMLRRYAAALSERQQAEPVANCVVRDGNIRFNRHRNLMFEQDGVYPLYAAPVQQPKSKASDEALREAHCNNAEGRYFTPRPVDDGAMQRKAFRAGFDRGWKLAAMAKPDGGTL